MATAAAAAGVRPTLPQKEWDKMTRKQRGNWVIRGGEVTLKSRVSRHMGIRGTRTGAEPEPTTERGKQSAHSG